VELSINANDNWWGTPEGPRPDRDATCPRIAGDRITLDSWLDSAP